MNRGAAAPVSPTWLLLGIGGAIVLGISALVWIAPDMLPASALLTLSLVVVAGILIASNVRVNHDYAFVTIFVLLSVFVQGNGGSGYGIGQVMFGLWIIFYSLNWYAKLVIGNSVYIRSLSDVIIVYYVFVVGILAAVMGLVNGMYPVDYVSDLACIAVLSTFFPIRDLCIKHKNGSLYLSLAIIVIGVFSVISNMIRFYTTINSANELYEIVDIRLVTGEMNISIAFIFVAVGGTVWRRWRPAAIVVGILLLAGLVLSKSRGAWLTTLLGLMGAGYAGGFRIQRRLVVGLVMGVAGLTLSSIAILGNRLVLIGAGLMRRVASLSSTSQDFSLMNRQAESEAAWEAIKASPFIGYGWGVPVDRFDLILKSTETWSFIHNGYFWMWHKTGLFGLAAFLIIVMSCIVSSLIASKSLDNVSRTEIDRAIAASCFGSIILLIFLAIPSNPFAVLDHMFMYTIVLALASGVAHRPARRVLDVPAA